ARKMAREIIVLRQRQHARQLEGGVDDFHTGIAKMGCEPFGGNEGVVGGHPVSVLAVIPGCAASRRPGIWRLLREIPGSRFARPGMTREKALTLLLRLPFLYGAAGVAPGGEARSE